MLRLGVTSGQDLGDVLLLREYERKQQRKNLAMMAGLDGLQKVFSLQLGPFAAVRNLGLDLVNASAPLKKEIVTIAMGLR